MAINSKQAIKNLIEQYKYGYSLAQAFYNDPDIYSLELQQIFHRHWLFAGHISQIPNTGDFFTLEFDTESVIVVHTKNSDIKAHHNVCRHRGSRICLETTGNKTRFTCPYHAWSYNLDGELLAARHMPDDFETNSSSLHSVHVELIGGLIFISLADEPLSLSDLHRDLDDVFELFGFDQLKLANRKSYNIPANWKLATENYQECYHCAPSHKEYAKVHAMALPPEEYQAKKNSFVQRYTGTTKLKEFNCYFAYANEGQEGYQYGRNPLLEGCKSGTKGGKSAALLLGQITEYDGGASEFMLGPVSFFLLYDDYIVGYRFTPTSIDQCVCDVYWLVHEDALPTQEYDTENLTWLWDVTTQADKEIIVNNQKGVESRYYQPGRLSKMEAFEQSFLDWYLGALTNDH